MGLGNFFKPFVGGLIGGAVGGPFGAVVGASLVSQQQKKKQKKRELEQQAQQQAQIAQLAQEKAIANESVRLQEEEARKRTLFAGTTLGQTAERKKLLGL